MFKQNKNKTKKKFITKIYRSKVQDTLFNFLNSKLFLKELYDRYCIEKEIHKNSMTFKTSWIPYIDIFRGEI